jgi:hypothetical protein
MACRGEPPAGERAVAVRELSQVVTGREKFIALGDDDPKAIVVKAEMPFDRQGYLDV